MKLVASPSATSANSRLESLPHEILAEIGRYLDSSNFYSLGRTSQTMRDRLQGGISRRQRICGEGSQLASYSERLAPSTFWQLVGTEAGVVSGLDAAPSALDALNAALPVAFSDDGRFVVNQNTEGRVIAYDALKPYFLGVVLTTPQQPYDQLHLFNQRSLLWARQGDAIELWDVGMIEAPIARFVKRHPDVQFQLACGGQYLVQFDPRENSARWHRSDALLLGQNQPAGIVADVTACAVAKASDKMIVWQSSHHFTGATLYDVDQKQTMPRLTGDGFATARGENLFRLFDLTDGHVIRQCLFSWSSPRAAQEAGHLWFADDGERALISPCDDALAWLDLTQEPAPVPNTQGPCRCGMPVLKVSPDASSFTYPARCAAHVQPRFGAAASTSQDHRTPQAQPPGFERLWLEQYTLDGEYALVNHLRISTSSAYRNTAEMVGESYGEAHDLPDSDETEFDDVALARMSAQIDGKDVSVLDVAVHPAGFWAIMRSAHMCVAYTLDGGRRYQAAVLRLLAGTDAPAVLPEPSVG